MSGLENIKDKTLHSRERPHTGRFGTVEHYDSNAALGTPTTTTGTSSHVDPSSVATGPSFLPMREGSQPRGPSSTHSPSSVTPMGYNASSGGSANTAYHALSGNISLSVDGVDNAAIAELIFTHPAIGSQTNQQPNSFGDVGNNRSFHSANLPLYPSQYGGGRAPSSGGYAHSRGQSALATPATTSTTPSPSGALTSVLVTPDTVCTQASSATLHGNVLAYPYANSTQAASLLGPSGVSPATPLQRSQALDVPPFIRNVDLRQFQPKLPNFSTSAPFGQGSEGAATNSTRGAITSNFRQMLGPVQQPVADGNNALLSYNITNNDALGTGHRTSNNTSNNNLTRPSRNGCCAPPSSCSSARHRHSANYSLSGMATGTTLTAALNHSEISVALNASSNGSSLPNAVQTLAADVTAVVDSSAAGPSDAIRTVARSSSAKGALSESAGTMRGTSTCGAGCAASEQVTTGPSADTNTTTSSSVYSSIISASEDQLCFLRTVESFRQYFNKANAALQLRRMHFASLSEEHRRLLGFDPDERIFGPYAVAIRENQLFLMGICKAAKKLFRDYWPKSPTPQYFSHPDFTVLPGELNDSEEDEDWAEGAECSNPPPPHPPSRGGDDVNNEDVANRSEGFVGTHERYREEAARRRAEGEGSNGSGNSVEGHTHHQNSSSNKEGPRTSSSAVTLGYSLEDITPTVADTEKVFSTLRQCVRDWGALGAEERLGVYGPIINSLVQYFPSLEQRQRVNVLVPGAGLSRLSVELALLGFSAFGNEFSYHMLIAGHFVMNHTQRKEQFVLYPYVDSTLNLICRSDQLCPSAVPDFCTSERAEEITGSLSMVAGDFLEVYGRPSEAGQWQCVITCFFIDTAHNVIDYLNCIYRCLAEGGLFINTGPLLYHFADSLHETSIELSLDEVLHVASRIGFVPLSPVQLLPTTYTNNALSMKQMVYQSAFFILQKPYRRRY